MEALGAIEECGDIRIVKGYANSQVLKSLKYIWSEIGDDWVGVADHKCCKVVR